MGMTRREWMVNALRATLAAAYTPEVAGGGSSAITKVLPSMVGTTGISANNTEGEAIFWIMQGGVCKTGNLQEGKVWDESYRRFHLGFIERKPHSQRILKECTPEEIVAAYDKWAAQGYNSKTPESIDRAKLAEQIKVINTELYGNEKDNREYKPVTVNFIDFGSDDKRWQDELRDRAAELEGGSRWR